MLLSITTLDNLEKEAQDIDDFLNITCSEDPNECVVRGLDLMTYLARSSKMLADAKYHLDEATKNSILNELKENIGLSPSMFKELVKATCKRENYIVNWVDRLNSSIVHQLDFLRTIISKAKAEQYQTRNIQ